MVRARHENGRVENPKAISAVEAARETACWKTTEEMARWGGRGSQQKRNYFGSGEEEKLYEGRAGWRSVVLCSLTDR